MLTAVTSPKAAYLAAGLATSGSALGALFLYWLGRKGGEHYLNKMDSPRTRKFRAWFHRYGLVTVFVPKLLPIPLPTKVFVLCAGALGVTPLQFLVVVLAARIPRYFALAYLGASLGDQAGPWLKAHAWHIGSFAAGLFVLLFLFVWWVDRTPKPEPVAD
jgi:membrane protein YqaA with SNARE-associated domain